MFDPYSPHAIEPDVSISIPAESGMNPIEAVESLINDIQRNPSLYVYVVEYKGQKYTVDMDATPPIVNPITGKVS